VLSLDEKIANGTDHYIDDIWVDESVVKAEEVREHLAEHGLVTMDPVPLADTRVLGLRVVKDEQGLHQWTRDGDLPVLSNQPTKRELFSVCGKLIGHYPVGGWLRTACSYIKRLTNETGWDETIATHVRSLAQELLDRVSKQDPVKGKWNVDSNGEGVVWCDASSMAIGCCLTVDDQVVEDAAWLRKEDDGAHINVAELEAVVKGLNLALKWEMVNLKVITDSASVYNWVRSILEDSKRPKVSGLSEMVIRRRLGTIAQLIEEYHINLTIQLVPSASNVADALTRVPQRWLRSVCMTVTTGDSSLEREVQMIHKSHHLGVSRTLHLARRICVNGDKVDRRMVERVVNACNTCRKVDPSPIKWDHGQLSVEQVWQRVAMDITYVNKRPYLSLIDCGPSRFAIWISLANETADQIIKHLNRVFQERCPPDELLSDYGPCFISSKTAQFLKRWGVDHVLCCAYKHSGNGIVERNHRTIKRMVARTGGKVEDMVFWYNNSPNSEDVVPAKAVYQYDARLPGMPKRAGLPASVRSMSCCPYQVGDRVYVKPANARCDTAWKMATVTKSVANTVVEVDGVNRHVADVRHAGDEQMMPSGAQPQPAVEIEYDGTTAADGNTDGAENTDRDGYSDTESTGDDPESDSDNSSADNQSVRERKPPGWWADYFIY
jgi:transposase InsO family protein